MELSFKLVNILHSYKQERGCLIISLMQFARRVNTLLKDEENARDNHVLAGNFANIHRFKFFFDFQTEQ